MNELIGNGAPVSAKVGFWAILLALIIGIPLGTTAAVRARPSGRRYFYGDRDGRSIGAELRAVCAVDVSVLRQAEAAANLRTGQLELLHPAGGLYGIWPDCLHYTSDAFQHAGDMRQDFIRTERSKGIPELVVIGKYALKNSILPVVTYVGPMVAALMTGTFIIEKVFSIPGLAGIL